MQASPEKNEKSHHDCHHEGHSHHHHHHHMVFDEKRTLFYANYVETRTFTLGYELLLLSDISKATNILEVGCGAGKLALEMAMQKKPETSLTATDFSEGMVKTTKEKFEKIGIPFQNVIVEQADGCALKYENETFDRYLSNLTIHHGENVENFVKEAYRVLKKQGVCAVSEFGREENCDSIKIMKVAFEKTGLDVSKLKEIFHFMRLPKELSFFKDLFGKAGFQDVKTIYSSMIANVTEGQDYIDRMVGMNKEKLVKMFDAEKTEILLKLAKEECDNVLKNNGVVRDECIIIIAKKL